MNRPLFCRIDEFGFILDTDEEEVEYNESNKKILMPDHQLTLKWIAFLEFQNDSEIQWLHMTERLRRSEKLEAMLEAGLPHILRSHVWMRLSGMQICLKDITKVFSFLIWLLLIYFLSFCNLSFDNFGNMILK